MTAFICISSKEYLNYYKILFESVKKHQPKYESIKQILYHIGDVQEQFDEKVDITNWFNEAKYNDTLTKICSLRARVVLDAFNKGYDKVVFLGAKIEFFSPPTLMIDLLSTNNAVVTPHITSPLPEDGKFPSNASVSFTGHISTDLVGFRDCKEIKQFLIWQDEIMKTKCNTTHHTYLDQSWLNFLPFFVNNVYILKEPEYNVAYWNMAQRNMKWMDGKWVVSDGFSYRPLNSFQYSGLVKGQEERISSHQNRWKAEGSILEFFKNYTNKL